MSCHEGTAAGGRSVILEGGADVSGDRVVVVPAGGVVVPPLPQAVKPTAARAAAARGSSQAIFFNVVLL